MKTFGKFHLIAFLWSVAACLSVSAETVSDSFEADAVSSVPSGWAGDCHVTNQVGSYTLDAGYPLSSADHERMLAFAGTATRTYTSQTGDRVVDMMVYVDELPAEEDDEVPTLADDVHFAIMVNHQGKLKICHRASASSSSATWSVISDAVVAAKTWLRVTQTFRYSHSGLAMCQIKVNGSLCVSDSGYRSETDLTTPGAWYYVAASASTLNSVSLMGCGSVDDVVNALNSSESPYEPPCKETKDAKGVDYAWYDAHNLPHSADATTEEVPGGSGYTVKEAFETGVDPYDTNKLHVATATYGTDKLTLTFNGYGKTYRVEKAAQPFADGTAGTEVSGTFTSNVTANTTTWTGTFPSEELAYYRVRSTAADTAETVNQFAIKRIDSSAVNTLVALPWKSLCADTNNPSAITAANVVMTNNLAVGDWLLYYADGYKGWCLTANGWSPTAQADVNGLTVSAAAADVELARGQAIWLVRTAASGRDLSKPFYLYGQYQEAKAATTVAAGGALVASPDALAAFDLSAGGKITDAAAGDQIVVPAADTNALPVTYEYRDNAWGTVVTTQSSTTGPDGKPYTVRTWTTSGDAMKIPAGRGFIYGTTNATKQIKAKINW